MKRLIAIPSLLFALLLVAPSARALDLGVIGPSYEISEPHLLHMIEQRLRAKERSGELKNYFGPRKNVVAFSKKVR